MVVILCFVGKNTHLNPTFDGKCNQTVGSLSCSRRKRQERFTYETKKTKLGNKTNFSAHVQGTETREPPFWPFGTT